MKTYFLGLDLGRRQDFTALSVVYDKGSYRRKQKAGRPGQVQHTTDVYWDHEHYELQSLKRYPQGVKYKDVAREVKALQNALSDHRTYVIVDATGVGDAVVEILRTAGVKNMYAIWITGGSAVTKPTHREIHVPKREIASTLAVLLQNGKLKYPPDLTDKKTFLEEALSFTVKITESGHDRYEHWRDGDHDDLVLSVGMACWFAEYSRPNAFKPCLI